MRETELRIALVCFGGVSLAVYMHGVSREILKLVRASKALHAIAGRGARLASSFAHDSASDDELADTEPIYYELLRELGRELDLRVIVDVIAGASAGGINGTMLARALSHDLPTGQLRDLWLAKADVTELLAPEAIAQHWSKLVLRPFIWLLSWIPAVSDAEVRSKLSLFVRSRWFKPPLDGPRMTAFMYDAALSMGKPANPRASLIPPGQQLDLFVALTDFYGRQQPIHIHDPPIIHDREHRQVLHFRYRQAIDGSVTSDFDLANVPALAFAARATSSFPGAFAPARIAEVDQLLIARRADWPTRQAFLARHFEHYAQLNIDAASASFIDGGVLNNRPFHDAIRAVVGKPAYRRVDRRLLYVDPDPARAAGAFLPDPPGFFATLKGALSDIPRVEPITEELAWVAAYNEQVRRLQGLIEEARPRVVRFVADITRDFHPPITRGQLQQWRSQASNKARHDAGFAYESYLTLKLASVRAFVGELIVSLRGMRKESPLAHAITAVIDAWAAQNEIACPSAAAPATGASPDEQQAQAAPSHWMRFLAHFDIDYRKRRLRFLIEGQNRRYAMSGADAIDDEGITEVGVLKRALYERLDRLRQRESPAFYSDDAREAVEVLFAESPTPAEMRDVSAYARAFAREHAADIERLLSRLAEEMSMSAESQELDEAFAKRYSRRPESMTELLTDHVGFSFWDVLTFPVMTWREAGEFTEIKVDRISPLDAHTFQELPVATALKGVSLGHFAGLLSRGYRETDYLLGRLHALDRLIDIVCDAANGPCSIDILALKRRGFLRVIEAEEKHLRGIPQLIAELRRWISRSDQP